MARKQKSIEDSIDLSRKKQKVFDVDMNIKVAYKTGKIIYGKNSVLKELRKSAFKMIILANNCPKELVSQLNYYNKLMDNKLFFHKYKGSSHELGLACAKPYWISVIGVVDPGDSELLSLKSKQN
jgi:large subunit ribosomal protein L30e